MKKALLIPLLILLSFALCAQEEEFTTYFAEKAQFTIDLPDRWSSSLVEKKVLASYNTAIVSMDAQEPGTLLFVDSRPGCRGPANEAKNYKKIFEKDAKKSADPAFKINAEGEEPDKDGKNYYWIDFTRTFEMEDGSKYVVRELFVARCHYAGMSKYANVFRFQTKEENWEKNKPLFDEIYNTVRFTKKQ